MITCWPTAQPSGQAMRQDVTHGAGIRLSTIAAMAGTILGMILGIIPITTPAGAMAGMIPGTMAAGVTAGMIPGTMVMQAGVGLTTVITIPLMWL